MTPTTIRQQPTPPSGCCPFGTANCLDAHLSPASVAYDVLGVLGGPAWAWVRFGSAAFTSPIRRQGCGRQRSLCFGMVKAPWLVVRCAPSSLAAPEKVHGSVRGGGYSWAYGYKQMFAYKSDRPARHRRSSGCP